MKILEYDEKLTFKSKYYDEEAVFLDIETTGLSPMRSFIYLIGLVFIDLKKVTMHITQLIAENRDEEEEIIKLTKEKLKGYKTVVTYNGNSFDLPFIAKRSERYGIEPIAMDSFDMYEKLRLHKDTLKLDGLKQKNIEKKLGITREDRYNGGECISFYKDYVKNKNQESFDRFVLHNYDDLLYMPATMSILDLLDEKITIDIDGRKYKFDKHSIKKDILMIDFTTDMGINTYVEETGYLIEEDEERRHLEFTLKTGYMKDARKVKYLEKSSLSSLKSEDFDGEDLVEEGIVPIRIQNKLFIRNIIKLGSI
ncbi:MAG: ribonuclease H-like domain-containing protein [Eubacteriales bacterium]|uniref:ribonuclease H-like domain-containing protein n=1 Tax=Fenollaria sp. TaxID=1965292 RepID=UPI002A75D8FD|nr:ribonuclease H-like domain-containing protein [Fenollaria sp.]MDD7340186.1 ribonuclease H-like domain-containing protein [Eubacteriales bacterium]MDY3105497.1 ribonuclease H-like domain-containing protein [Fenollaria sp.]